MEVKVLFWILAILILLPFPPEWSFISYLLITHVDMSGPEWASASGIGWENALKIVVLPTVLILRFRLREFPKVSKVFVLWIIFVMYMSITSLWSPFPISGLKLIGYLYGHTATFIICMQMFSINKERVYKLTSWALWLSLVLAIVQTYLLGNPFGTSEQRFTSFSSPQSFAAWLTCALAIILMGASSPKGFLSGTLISIVVLAGVILSGSNTMFIGALFVVAGWTFAKILIKPSLVSIVQLFALLSSLSIAIFYLPSANVRATRALSVLLTNELQLNDIGTFAWRLMIYQRVLEEVRYSKSIQVLFGHGASSGANLMVRFFGYDFATVDANRVLHNEWLRIFYEGGIVGLFLFCLFLGALIWIGLSSARRNRSSWPFLVIVPMLIGLLAVENVLASAGNPMGIGLALILGAMAGGKGN